MICRPPCQDPRTGGYDCFREALIVEKNDRADIIPLDAAFALAAFQGGVAFREYGSYLSASRALESGEVDAFIADGSILSGFSDEGRVLLPDQLSVQEYGVGRSNLMTEYAQMY